MSHPPSPCLRSARRNGGLTWILLVLTVMAWAGVACAISVIPTDPYAAIPTILLTPNAIMMTLQLRVQLGNSRGRGNGCDGEQVAENPTPAEESWRRRGWLVVLRARDQAPAAEASLCPPFAALGRFITGNCRVRQPPPRRLELAARGSDLEDGGAAEERDLRALAFSLVRVEEEGIFRAIVLCI